MDLSLTFIIFTFCIPSVAFFTAFALTFGAPKFRFAAAASYNVGILFRMGIYAYFHFFRRWDSTFGMFPMVAWVTPILLLCFGIAAVALLWPAIPQHIAMRRGMILFFVICPILIVVQIIPEFLQFHRMVSFDLASWVLYAVLWFRIRDGYANAQAIPPRLVP